MWFFMIVKKISNYCRMDFKPRVHMASEEDVLDIVMDSLLRSIIPQK